MFAKINQQKIVKFDTVKKPGRKAGETEKNARRIEREWASVYNNKSFSETGGRVK